MKKFEFREIIYFFVYSCFNLFNCPFLSVKPLMKTNAVTLKSSSCSLSEYGDDES